MTKAGGLWPAILLAACSRAPAPLATPAPPPPPDSATIVRTAMVAPRLATGAYRMSASIQSSARRSARTARIGAIQLSNEPSAAPMMGAPSGAQFNATVALPGYTRGPRGRSGQAAAWWPIGGDSVVVQFAGQGAQIQLRGAVQGARIQGEIWYLSLDSGSSLQLGTFAAVKR